MSRIESWESSQYAVEWASDDVVAELLTLPRRISVALAADARADVRHVVDLGSGEGPYLEELLRAFPDARGTWVDANEAMRGLAEERLAPFGDRVRFVLADVEQVAEAQLEQADVIATSRVLHHFSPDSLRRVYGEVFELLTPGGFFFNLDHIGAPGEWDGRYRRIRDQFTGRRRRALKPHRHDYPLPAVEDHLGWARGAGFDADVPWRAFYTALIAAKKPS